MEFADRIDHLAKIEAFITLKDRKENFVNKLTCRLIKPTKTELSKISQKIIEDINKQLIEKLKVNQWKSTKNVTDWFKKIDNKKDCTFIQFDIKEFYPAISESILGKAFNFAKEFIDIESSNLRIFKNNLEFPKEISSGKKNR